MLYLGSMVGYWPSLQILEFVAEIQKSPTYKIINYLSAARTLLKHRNLHVYTEGRGVY